MDTYIINPWMIYLIEQLNSIEYLLSFISLLSFSITCISLYKVLSELHRNDCNNSYYGYSTSCNITDHLAHIEDVCLNIQKYHKEISEELSEINSKESLTINEKENISGYLNDALYKTNSSLEDLNKLNDILNHHMRFFVNYKKILKISLIVLVSSILLNTFIPSKDAAYKILISSYITQENINNMGNITTDIANGIVDKLTESIIKIQEAGK